MAKGVPLTDDDKLRICEMLEKNLRPSEIAKKTGLSHQSIYRVRNEMYGKDIRSMDTVIAGDKRNGTLKATGPSHFVGTCLTKGGKMKTKHFTSSDSKQAIAEWEKWKDSVHDRYACPKKQKEKETFVATYDNSQIIQANKPVHHGTMVEYLYILAVGEPKVAAWFIDESKARQAMEVANQALEFAGVDIRYSVLEVKRQD